LVEEFVQTKLFFSRTGHTRTPTPCLHVLLLLLLLLQGAESGISMSSAGLALKGHTGSVLCVKFAEPAAR